MDFFAKGFSALSSQYLEQETEEQKRKKYMEFLGTAVETYTTSSVRGERRESLQKINEISKHIYLDDASLGVIMDVIVKEGDEDADMLVHALESMVNYCNIIVATKDSAKGIPELRSPEEDKIVLKRIETFINEDLIKFIPLFKKSEYIFAVYNTGKFIELLLQEDRFRPMIQSAILSGPMSVPTIVDMLGYKQELLRNEALVLIHNLCKGNIAIQKIVAFQGTFKTVFNIAMEEGGAEAGSVVTRDCLNLLEVLLDGNESNQNLFRESAFFNEFSQFLGIGELAASPRPIPKEVVETFQHGLKVARILCAAPDGGSSSINLNRAGAVASGLLQSILYLLIGPLGDFKLAEDALYTVATMISGSLDANRYILSATYNLKLEGGKSLDIPIVMALLNIIVRGSDYLSWDCKDKSQNDKMIRSAALKVIETIVADNYDAQYNLAMIMVAPRRGFSVSDVVIDTIFANPAISETPALTILSVLRLFSIMISGNTNSKEKLAETEISIKDPAQEEKANGGAGAGQTQNEAHNVNLLELYLRTMRSYYTLPEEVLHSRVFAEFLIVLSTWLIESPASLVKFILSDHFDEILLMITNDGVSSTIQALACYVVGICIECSSGQLIQVESSTNVENGSIESEKVAEINAKIEAAVEKVRTEIGIDNFTGLLSFIAHADEIAPQERKKASKNSEKDFFRLFLPSFSNSYHMYHEKIRRRFLKFYLSPNPAPSVQRGEETNAIPLKMGGEPADGQSEASIIESKDIEISNLNSEIKQLEKDINSLKTSLSAANEAAIHWKGEFETVRYQISGIQDTLKKEREEHEKLEKNHNDLLLLVAEMQEPETSSEEESSDEGEGYEDEDGDAPRLDIGVDSQPGGSSIPESEPIQTYTGI